jgi:hypothetical protein
LPKTGFRYFTGFVNKYAVTSRTPLSVALSAMSSGMIDVFSVVRLAISPFATAIGSASVAVLMVT